MTPRFGGKLARLILQGSRLDEEHRVALLAYLEDDVPTHLRGQQLGRPLKST